MFLLDLVELRERLDLLVMAFPLKPLSVCLSPVILERFNQSGFPFLCENIYLHGLYVNEYKHVIIYWKKWQDGIQLLYLVIAIEVMLQYFHKLQDVV